MKTLFKTTFFCGCLFLSFQSCEKSQSDEEKVILSPINFKESYFEKLENPLSDALVYSKGVYLKRNSVIQSMDVATDGTIYYVQIAGTDQHQLHILRGAPNITKPTDFMTFEYFGHGTNMAVEEENNETYVWMGSHGNKGSDGSYGGSQTISRVKFEKDKTVQLAAGEVFHLNGARNIHPAINKSKDLLGIQYSKKVSGVDSRFFLVYRLSEAMKLPETEVKLDLLKYGGEGSSEEISKVLTIQARELSQIQPLYRFAVSDGFGGIVGELPFQGYDIDDKFVYYYEGEGNGNDVKVSSKAYVSVIDRNGLLSARKDVTAINDCEALKSFGLADRGYMEAEGIKIKNGNLYLGFASRMMNGNSDERLANILVYKNE